MSSFARVRGRTKGVVRIGWLSRVEEVECSTEDPSFELVTESGTVRVQMGEHPFMKRRDVAMKTTSLAIFRRAQRWDRVMPWVYVGFGVALFALAWPRF